MNKTTSIDKIQVLANTADTNAIEIEAQLDIKTISITELLKSYDYETVLGFCTTCGNAEKNHSCPTHLFDPKAYVSQYEFAAIILTEIDTRSIKAHLEVLKTHQYPSRVYEDYLLRKPDVEIDWNSMLSMYAFNSVKDDMADRLLEAEKIFGNCLSLPPGACTRCAVCLKKCHQPCCEPEKLRYSLEALGFLVSDIYEKIFHKEMGWTGGELPDSFTTCSALLSKTPINHDQVLKVIGAIKLMI